jgi:hypothetical protein
MIERGRDLDHAKNTELLNAELPDQRFVDATYLHWLYDLNPLGVAFSGNVDADDYPDVRVAHYALIPQQYRNADETARFVFSLNAVTRSGTQRRGYFSEIGSRIWAQARDDGVRCVIGVTNDKSIEPVRRQGWRLLGRMVTKVVPPRPGTARRFTSIDVTPDVFSTVAFESLLEGLDDAPAVNWTNRYTREYLTWRLASPNTPPYAIHADDSVFAVTTKTAFKGIPVAVILKLLPRRGRAGSLSGKAPLSGHRAVTAACVHHRTPFAVYAGFNHHVRLRGVRVPERFKPAPLNLMAYVLDESIDQETFTLDTFEFLDMDAY